MERGPGGGGEVEQSCEGVANSGGGGGESYAKIVKKKGQKNPN